MKTVKVKVCVAVNDKGNWYAVGSSSYRDQESIDYVEEGLDYSTPNKFYWLESDISIAEIETIKANVKEIKE